MTGSGDLTSTPDDRDKWWGDPSRFDDEPQAVAAQAAFERLVATGNADEILAGLEVAWMQVDRAALWLSSHLMAWASPECSVAEKTCLMTLPTLVGQLRAVSALGRADLSLLPTALMAGRSAFEIGLRIAWVYSAEDLDSADHRALRFRHKTERWMQRVASRLEANDVGPGDRWREAADRHGEVVADHLEQSPNEGDLRLSPPVFEQLSSLGLERLYHGYQLASEHGHGSIASGGEILAVRLERSPYGLYWPQDWSLPLNLCAWGCVFVAQHYPADELDVGPVRGLMWAANLLLELAPGIEEGCGLSYW